jgi:hypothetical protein
MIRSLFGFAVFAILVMVVFKFLGGLVFVGIGLFFSLLKLAFLGFCFYVLLKLFAPDAAKKVKDTIKGEPTV